MLQTGIFHCTDSLSLVFAAVHAGSDGWLFSLWASRKISRWCAFGGVSPFSFCLSVNKCANFWLMHPHKLIVKVHDRRDEEFTVRLPWDKFPGEGQAVHGGRYDSASVVVSQIPGLSCSRHTDTHKLSSRSLSWHFHIYCWFTGKKLTTHQFLSRLPKVVVKAGRVIDIRDSLRATLQVSSGQSTGNFCTHCSAFFLPV